MVGYDEESQIEFINLCKGIVKRKIKKIWFCHGSVKMGMSDEVLKWARKSGCRMVYIGIESNIGSQLEEVNKQSNIKCDYEQLFRNFHKHNIAVSGSIIFGFENETKDTMQEKTAYAIKSQIDAFHFSVLTPLPRTIFFNKLKDENRLIYINFPQDWEFYDDYHLLFKLKKMTKESFYMELFSNMRKIFSLKNIFVKFIKTMVHSKSIFSSLVAFVSNFEHRSDWHDREKKWHRLNAGNDNK